MLQFTNPYPSQHKEPDPHRVNAVIPRSTMHRVRSVLNEHGDLNTAVNIFIRFIEQHITTNDYTYGDRTKLITTILERCAEGITDPKGPDINDGRRASTIRPTSTGTKVVQRHRTRNETATKG